MHFITSISVSDGSYHEERLLKDLFSRVDTNDLRPVANDSDNVTVEIGLTLSQIIDVVSMLESQTSSPQLCSINSPA
jgi:hypothetical protein